MTAALAILLTLLGLEGLLLTTRPALVKAFLAESPVAMLRIIGVAELVVVAAILAFVLRFL